MNNALSTAMAFSDEQSMLLDTATDFFRDKATIDYVRGQIETPAGFDNELWQELAKLGWLGLAIPEESGGSGLGLAAAVPISEPMGRQLFAAPFLSTQLAVQALLHAPDALSAEWLPKLASGRIGTVAVSEPGGSWNLQNSECVAAVTGSSLTLTGTKTFVADAQAADVLVVSAHLNDAPVMVVVPTDLVPDGALTRQVVVDETRRCYQLALDGIEVPAANLIDGSRAKAALGSVRNAALLLLSAEACGGIAGALDLIVEYLNTRTQFGRQIGGYQALKHPTVDVLIGLERSRSHLYHAASLLEQGLEPEVALRMAKAEAGDSFAFAGDRAVQFHGGFGFTYECDAQLFLRRAMWCQYQFGDAAHHRKHLADMLL
ncbi:MAG: acyl-CoA/acyl-ACP dehydrogenase [Gammaproteobacteria bacterium]|nr:acyl-CoA/acyl-ACP dehydrogenase [Gammaproteobacteria bacterium]